MTKKEQQVPAEPVKSLWDFPTEGITVEASSYEEALVLLQQSKQPIPTNNNETL